MITPQVVRVAVFLGGVVLGVSLSVRATPPCPLSEKLALTIKEVTVDGARVDAPAYDPEVLHIVPASDGSGTYPAWTYDRVTGMTRGVNLRREP